MITKVQKWGNSLGLRIPMRLAKQARVERGSEVDVTLERGRLVIRPTKPAKHRLRDLLARVKPRNLHGSVDTRAGVGREMR